MSIQWPTVGLFNKTVWCSLLYLLYCFDGIIKFYTSLHSQESNSVPSRKRGYTYCPCCIQDFKHTLLTVYFHLLGKKGRDRNSQNWRLWHEESQLHFLLLQQRALHDSTLPAPPQALLSELRDTPRWHMGQLLYATGLCSHSGLTNLSPSKKCLWLPVGSSMKAE